jgi:intracellular sulfur oxidation DsrE/DsrF family protein
MHRIIGVACVIGCVLLAGSSVTRAAADDDGIRIDLPVVLRDAKVVFNLEHATFQGDEPIGLNFLRVMTDRFRSDGTQAQIVAVFHAEAGYMLLNDAAYDRVRRWTHGNPYKDQIAALRRDGVQIEECAQTMKANHWRNDDLLPEARVNSGANFRIVQLVQEGFVQLQP